MLVLDTNTLRDFLSAFERGLRLRSRMQESGENAALTVITIEESMRGWLAEIQRRTRQRREQIEVYRRMALSIEMFARWTMFHWDVESADIFTEHRRNGVRIGTLDLKITSIAIAHDALLLTRNTVDFAKVPGLRFENWAD
jgi:tRNA(fMet)-specific endonuclease VapC